MTSATPKPRAGEHTPAPWYSDQDGFIYTERDDEDQIVVAKAHEHPRMNATLMNARRIVACVNACEGVENAELEDLAALKCAIPGVAGVAQMAILNDTLEAGNIALREALQAIVSADIRYQSSEIAIKAHSNNRNIAEQVTAYDLRQRAIEQARALLAKHGR